jgi:hypothetical protein
MQIENSAGHVPPIGFIAPFKRKSALQVSAGHHEPTARKLLTLITCMLTVITVKATWYESSATADTF